MTAEERLIAYLDGELTSDERARFEAEMSGEPALAAAVARHRALADRIAQAYAPVLDEPVPQRLAALASAANDRGRPQMRVAQWAAMAACLAVGVIAGRMIWPHQGPLETRDGTLVARGELAKALTGQLAAEPGVVKVGLSFKTADGRYCRTFQSRAERLAGLACREDGRWVARTTTAFDAKGAPDYRTAASDTPPAVLAAVDATIAGEPLDARAERAARDKGWRP
jgi:hypothetical protein